jgi:hypothetical protein
MGCNEYTPPIEPSVTRIAITYRYSYEKPTDPLRESAYFIVSCAAGAYNETSVLISADPYAKVLRPVPLASPVISKNKIVGFSAEIVTGSLSFDPKTSTLTMFSKGRGLGDMYVMAKYRLFETQVILREYTNDNVEGDNVLVKPIFKATDKIYR